MIYYLTYLKDSTGQNYLGINIPSDIVDPFRNELETHLGADCELFINNQQKRDAGHNHITVINVMEYNRLCKEEGIDKFINSLEPIFKYEIDDLEFSGVGTAAKNDNKTFFIVCESDKLDAIRTRYNLPKQDLHITIGFNPKDVFGVPKNEVIKK